MSELKTIDVLDKEEQVRERVNNPRVYIENMWLSRASTLRLNPKSVAYKKAEIEFFAGAMAALCAVDPRDDNKMFDKVPPVWIINPMTGCNIIEQ